jgi:Glycosyl transferase family 2
LRIAISNSFAGQEVAETGLSRRIYQAALSLGWEAAEVSSSTEINTLNPDFVIALHFFTPKLTRHPTYGCMWNPPSFFEREDSYVKNVLSYDGYLSSSPYINNWLRDKLRATHKKYFLAPFYTSCHYIPYQPPDISRPRLVYAGTNWDGPRYKKLFQRLDSEPYVDIYGGEGAWSYLKHSYRGVLPFDGSSILTALNRAGAGLCLHKEEHRQTATPSLRIFEIAASGAVAICQEHPFIREAFGDSVLYLGPTLNTQETVRQISEHMRWITLHREEALAMSRRAYKIFAEGYSLERLLSQIAPHHQKLISEKGFVAGPVGRGRGVERVQFIVRVGNSGLAAAERALNSIAGQTYPHVAAIVVKQVEVAGLRGLLKKYERRFPVEVVDCAETVSEGALLWAGLKAVSSEYFAVLDDDAAIYPNHVGSLISLLDEFGSCGLAYSGVIHTSATKAASNGQGSRSSTEPATLAYFEPFNRDRLTVSNNPVSFNSFVARSRLISDIELPQLNEQGDSFLTLCLSTKTDCLFSYEATCEVFNKRALKDEGPGLVRRVLRKLRLPSSG